MWLGKGEFDSYGYYKGSAYFKGNLSPSSNPAICYFIFNENSPGSESQFALVPINEQGEKIGSALYRTSGQVLYSTWQAGKTEKDFDISDTYIKD